MATHAPVDTNYEILDLVAPAPVIRHHVHLAGGGVALGVSRKRERQGAVKVGNSHGVQVVRQLHGRRASFDDGIRAAGVPNDVGVRRKRRMLGRPVARGWCAAENVAHFFGAYPTVAVPLGLAAIEAYAVHHAVAGKPVILRFVDIARRVRPVAQVSPGELGRNRASYAQVGDGDFFVHRCQVARQERVG